jgi:hypothetical protein
MLLLTPHTSFYNWSMLSIAAVLLLHSDLRPRALVPALLGGVALAAAASQANTPFPLPRDVYRPAGTLGIYWITPAVLVAVALLAVVGRRAAAPASAAPLRLFLPDPGLPARIRAAAAMAPAFSAAVFAGVIAAAYVTHAGPFATDRYFSRADVLAALPADFPTPPESAIGAAGPGERLPYAIDWQSTAPVSEVAGIMREQLDDGSWQLVDSTVDADGALRLRSTRDAGDGGPLLAELYIAPDGDESDLRLEFSPLPASSVPGYDEWLRDLGIVVHHVDPGSAAADVPPVHR